MEFDQILRMHWNWQDLGLEYYASIFVSVVLLLACLKKEIQRTKRELSESFFKKVIEFSLIYHG